MKALLLGLLLLVPTSKLEANVKYILSPEVYITDSNCDPLFQKAISKRKMLSEFNSKFASKFGPNSVRKLSIDNLLSPNEPVIAVFPILQLVRISREKIGGNINKYATIIVGSISFINPWTGSTIFSTTKMIEVTNEIGESKRSLCKVYQKKSFSTAYTEWLTEMMSQCAKNVDPFVLNTQTIATPREVKLGRIINAGYSNGIKKNLILQGPRGMRLIVRDVQKNLSRVEDIFDSKAKIPIGTKFSVTLNRTPNRPGETPGLKVLLSIGDEENFGMEERVFSSDTALSIFKNYLSKSDKIRVLPIHSASESYKDSIRNFFSKLNRYSEYINTDLLDISLKESQILAREDFDIKIVLSKNDAFYAVKKSNNGINEVYVRTLYSALVLGKMEFDNKLHLTFHNYTQQTEENVTPEMEGVRIADKNALWLTVNRNCIIKLAKRIEQNIDTYKRPSSAIINKAVVKNDGQLLWPNDVRPQMGRPLVWYRPSRNIFDKKTGKSYGKFFLNVMTKSGLPLTLATLGNEKLKTGDIISFSSNNDIKDKPKLFLKTGNAQVSKNWTAWKLTPKEWLLSTAKFLKEQNGDLIIFYGTDFIPDMPVLKQFVTVEKYEEHENCLYYQIAWRLKLFTKGHTVDPIWKIGKRFKKELCFNADGISIKDVRANARLVLNKCCHKIVNASIDKSVFDVINSNN